MKRPTSKADAAAAERLLNAAVRDAVRTFRAAPCTSTTATSGAVFHWCATQGAVAERLAEVCRSADLLLGGAS